MSARIIEILRLLTTASFLNNRKSMHRITAGDHSTAARCVEIHDEYRCYIID